MKLQLFSLMAAVALAQIIVESPDDFPNRPTEAPPGEAPPGKNTPHSKLPGTSAQRTLTIEGQYIWDLVFDYDNSNNTGDILEAFI